MTIADRIQQQRKMKGISQEELADQLGVSRQTVSKWESEQSAPDIEKVVLMSEYFGVTTDYLLKGIEKTEEEGRKTDARVFSLAGCLICFAGVLVSIAVWLEYVTPAATAAALICDAAGIAVFLTGQYIGSNQEQAKVQFWLTAVWPLLLVPYSLLFNAVQGLLFGFGITFQPFPEITGNAVGLGITGWLIYFALCIVFDCIWISRKKGKKKE